jgi:hypothetical protein
MPRRPTIAIDSERARPQITSHDPKAGYEAMTADKAREREAKEWESGLIGDIGDEPTRRAD